jgi:hypothetical protein
LHSAVRHFDLRFHSESDRAKAEAQLCGGFDAEDATRLVAPAIEQLTLITNDWFHGIPLVVGENPGRAISDAGPPAVGAAKSDSERLK